MYLIRQKDKHFDVYDSVVNGMFNFILSAVFMIFVHSTYVHVKRFPPQMVMKHVKPYSKKFL